MRPVKFIESLNIKDVMLYEGEDLRYQNLNQITRVDFANSGDAISESVKETVVPVHHFIKSWVEIPENGGVEENKTEETFIAYSEEVEKFLAYPIATLKDELGYTLESLSSCKDNLYGVIEANKEFSKILEIYRTAGFWRRLKFLFTNKI